MITCDHRADVLTAPCGAPATHRVRRSARPGADGWYMCAEHTEDTRRRYPRWQYRRIES